MESLQLDTPKNEPSPPWWRHRWLRATSLIVAGVLAGSIVGNDGEAQIAELAAATCYGQSRGTAIGWPVADQYDRQPRAATPG